MTFTEPTTPMTTSSLTTLSRPKVSRYAVHVCGLLLAAFGLSAGYTVWSTATGVAHDTFTATDPAVWGFYAAMVAVSLLVLTDRLVSWILVAIVLPLLLGVGVFVYPTIFTPEQQTPFGWFENDVYLGLLMVATYLTLQRLRRRSLTP